MNGKGIAILSGLGLLTYLLFGKKSNAVIYTAVVDDLVQEYTSSDNSAGIDINHVIVGNNGQAGFEYSVFLQNAQGTGLDNVFTDTIYAGDAGYTHDLGSAVVVVTPDASAGTVEINIYRKVPQRILFSKDFTYTGTPV